MTVDSTLEAPKQAPLVALTDRCDKCGAQALVRAVMPSGFELLFCNHHHRDNAAKLEESGAAAFDQQGKHLSEPTFKR